MLNIRIWIRNPYPFQDAEVLRKMVHREYAFSMEYSMLSDVHYADIDGISLTTARAIALSLKSVHLYQALLASRSNSRVHAEDVEVEILGQGDSPPQWARKAYSGIEFGG